MQEIVFMDKNGWNQSQHNKKYGKSTYFRAFKKHVRGTNFVMFGTTVRKQCKYM